MKEKKKDSELISLNDKLFDEFYVNQLEERLETDPLATGGLFHLFSSQSGVNTGTAGFCIIKVDCREFLTE